MMIPKRLELSNVRTEPATTAVSGGCVEVFLCHNSKDKPLARQVAEGLEREFGILR
jgi:hypothetical protein